MGLLRGHFMLLFILLAQWVSKVTSQDLGIAGCPITPVRLAVARRTDMVLGTWTEAISTNSDVILADRSHIPGEAMFPVGYTDVIYTFRNTVTEEEGICNFTFVVFWVGDDQPPQIQGCPQDITRTASSSSSFTTVSVSWSIPTAIDNAGPVRLQNRTHDPPFEFPIGTTPVIYTFEDTRGLQATCEFNVNIMEEDVEPPVIVCPGDQSVLAPVGETQAIVRWSAVTATDNAGTPTLISMIPQTALFGLTGGTFSIGTTPVSYVYSDMAGNLATCAFNVEVMAGIDIDPPVVSCPENGPSVFTVASGSTGQAFWSVPMVISDESLPVQTVSNFDPGDIFPIGTTRVEYSFIDRVENEARCAFSVVVQDTTPPVFTNCPQRDIAADILVGQVTMGVSWVTITAVDNSGLQPSIVGTHQSGSQFSQGSTMVSFTAEDRAGNQATCNFNVVVNPVDDPDPPIIIGCPTTLTMVAPSDQQGAVVTWTEPTAEADLGVSTRDRSHVPPEFFPIGRTQVVYTFTDLAGNVATCNFDVIVQDQTPPEISNCPSSPIRASLLPPQTMTIVTFTPLIATDNSQGVITDDCTHNSGDVFPEGTTLVICEFTDESGNSNVCMFQVIVEGIDVVSPVIMNCPNDITRQATGLALVSVEWSPIIVTDDSGIQPTRLLGPPDFQDLFSPGTSEIVVYIYSDAANNIAECMFTVTIVAPSGPVIDCSGLDIIMTAPPNQPCAVVELPSCSATSNAGTVIQVSQLPPSGSCFSIGVATVTNTFRDSNGLQGFGTFSVTVNRGDAPPVVTCGPDIVRQTPISTGGLQVNFEECTATDDSGTAILVSSSHTPGQFFGIGTTVVTYTFTDLNGNTGTGSFTIIVNGVVVDNVPPVVTCGQDIVRQTPFSTGGLRVNFAECTATDNSGTAIFVSSSHTPGQFFGIGTTEVIYTFTDQSGNTGTGSFTITVNGGLAITCPDDGAGVPQVGTGDVIGVWSDPGCIGGVSPLSTSCTPPLGSVIRRGDTQVVCTCTDSRGASDGCGFIISVDAAPPEISCPTNARVITQASGAIAVWSDPSCEFGRGSLNVRCNPPSGSVINVGQMIVTCTCTDSRGAEDMCVFAVDTQPPEVDCSGLDIFRTIPIGAPCVLITLPSCAATDNSGTVTPLPQSPPSPFCFPDGTRIVTNTFQDPSGNEGTGTFTVTILVDDTVPPTVDCSGLDIIRNVAFDTSNTIIILPTCRATDDSGIVTPLSQTPPSGSSFPVGTTTVVNIFEDPSGNRGTGTFTVTIIGDMPVVIICPTPSRVPQGNSGTDIGVWSDPTCTGGRNPLNIRCDHQSGNVIPLGVTTVTCTCTDSRGEEDTCPFELVGIDETPPEVDCSGQNIVRTISFGTPCVVITLPTCVATDNSGTITPLPQSLPSTSCFPVGTTTVMNIFQDPSGNEGNGTFTVTVIPVPPVVISCPTDGRSVTQGNLVTAIGIWSDATCTGGRVPLDIRCDRQSGVVIPVGITTVTCTCTDSSGEEDSCSFTVGVDVEPPVVNCAGLSTSVNAALGQTCVRVTFQPCTATDNQGRVTLVSQSHQSGFCFPEGVTEVIFRFRDDAGNIGMDSFTVTVILANPCDNSRCLNGGVCMALSLTDSRCVCTGCFTGPSCQVSAAPCGFNRCENGGTCQPLQGSCQASFCNCPPCYTGLTCQTRVGACRNHECQNGAVCVPASLDCDQYTCQCPSCFMGDFCQIAIPNPCNSSPCLNGGQCTRVPDSCYDFSCTCRIGFSGERCEQVVIVLDNPCNNFPCLNQGSCISFGSTYKCICRPGFLGRNCQETVGSALSFEGCSSNSPCQNGGTCFESYTSTSGLNPRISQYICICSSGFTGERCAIPVNQAPQLNRCLGTNICQNGGTCRNSYCSFQDRIDFFCECPIGFIGEVCSILYGNPCSTSPCGDGGVCQPFNQYFVCSCLPGYSGITCDQTPTGACNPNPCQNGGNCRIIDGRFSCICPSGFTGQTCTQVISGNPCASLPCLNGGTCVMLSSEVFVCLCETGLDGPRCENGAQDVCSTRPCQNGGTCIRVPPGDFVCLCNTGFQGERCQSGLGGVDVTPPDISNCPGNTTISFSPGINFVSVSWTEPTAEDESPPIEREQNRVSPAFLERGQTLNVIYEFTDRLGNTATCSFFFFSNGP